MKLDNVMVIAAPPAEVWPALLDLERVGACIPGATIEPGGEGGTCRGTVRVKLGPVSTEYAGTVRMLDVDEERRTASLELQARETRGHGAASAIVTNQVAPDGSGATRVAVGTELRISGRAAQLGSGILEDVAAGMLDAFASGLARELSEPVSHGDPLPAGDVLDAGSLTHAALRRRLPAILTAAGALGLVAALGAMRARTRQRRRRLDYRW